MTLLFDGRYQTFDFYVLLGARWINKLYTDLLSYSIGPTFFNQTPGVLEAHYAAAGFSREETIQVLNQNVTLIYE